jgi:hypothetical protein
MYARYMYGVAHIVASLASLCQFIRSLLSVLESIGVMCAANEGLQCRITRNSLAMMGFKKVSFTGAILHDFNEFCSKCILMVNNLPATREYVMLIAYSSQHGARMLFLEGMES